MRKLLPILLAVLLILVACQSATEPEATPAPTAEVPPTVTAAPATATAEPTDTVAPTATTAPTEEPTTEPTATPAPTEEATVAPATGFCPDIPRPALLLFIPGEQYVIADPESGQSCDLPFPEPLPGMLQVAGDQIYYHVAEDNNLVVHRLAPDGSVEPLAFTALDTSNGMFQSFLVSADGKYIAWGYAGAKEGDPSMTISEMWVAETATGQITAELLDFSQPGEGPHGLVPVRFSDDNSTIFFARQPIGIGGSWMSFIGRYDSLSSTPTTGGVITEHFNCTAQQLFLCIGDFYVVDGQLANLAYTDPGSIVVLNGEGEVINTIGSDQGYVGYPTFSPSAELAFYTAEITDQSITPLAASLHRVAPPTAPSEVVISDPNLLLPNTFLDDTRLVTGYIYGENNFGNAIVDLSDGSLTSLAQWPNGTVYAILR
jgi:hypothetical protein